MDGLWRIIEGWDGLWQWLFIIGVLGGIGDFLIRLAHHVGIWLHGWPPENARLPEDDEDDLEDDE